MTFRGASRKLALAFAFSAAGIAATAAQTSFQFGLIGDMPYSHVEEREFLNVIAQLNAKELAFVVHVGDMQNDARPHNAAPGRSMQPCSDEVNDLLVSRFATIRHPFVMTPGDNDWADCHALAARKVDPLERLDALRKKFYPDGRSLGGRTMPVVSQASEPQFSLYRENLRWSIGGVTFVTLHITGSNDNFSRTPEMDAEHRARKTAVIAWMKQAFASAKADNSRGLVIMTQANPAFENSWEMNRKTLLFSRVLGIKPPNPPVPTAFEDYIKTLADEMESYDKPVAFLHGDTHMFRVDQPLYSEKTKRPFENFTRVETFGSPNSHWVLVTVDPADPQLFRFQAQIVPENVANRRSK